MANWTLERQTLLFKGLLLANNKFASSNLYFEKKKPTYFAPILAHHVIIICGINYQNMEKLVGRYIVAMKRGFLIYIYIYQIYIGGVMVKKKKNKNQVGST